MDQMSALKVKTNVLKELIETKKSASKMKEDGRSLLESKLREDNTSLLREQLMAALHTSRQDCKKTYSTTIQKYRAMGMEYIALQDEYLALAKCTTGE